MPEMLGIGPLVVRMQRQAEISTSFLANAAVKQAFETNAKQTVSCLLFFVVVL